jgi:Uma2 family endonuclease
VIIRARRQLDRRSPLACDRATDRDRKLPDYRTIPSLEDILVVSSTEPRIEHFHHEADGWKIRDLRGQGTLRLEAFDVTIDLAELYAGLLPPADAQAGRPGSSWFGFSKGA